MVSADGLSKFPTVKWCPQMVWANSQLWNGVRRWFEQIPSCEMMSADGLSKFPAVKWSPQTVWANSQLWNGVRRQFEQIPSCETVSAFGWRVAVIARRSRGDPLVVQFAYSLDCFTAFAMTSRWYWIASLYSQWRVGDTGLLHCVRKDGRVKG